MKLKERAIVLLAVFGCALCAGIFGVGRTETTIYANGEAVNFIHGDIDGDGKLTAQDAEYLLYHYFNEEKFPVAAIEEINQKDINNDGVFTVQDAVYLSQHIDNPEQYPFTHQYNEVAEDKHLKTAATCENGAVYYTSCVCGEQNKTQTFVYGSALGHTYKEVAQDSYLKTAATCNQKAVYYKSCACGELNKKETFTHGTTLAHNYATEYCYDENQHWLVCSNAGCTEVKDVEKHEYDDGRDLHCNDCDFIRAECIHVFTNACDEECDKCLEVRTAPHNFEAEYSSDDNYHWLSCNDCGEITNRQEHSYANDCDNVCTLCGYTRAVGHDYQYQFNFDEAGERDCKNGFTAFLQCERCQSIKEYSVEHYQDHVTFNTQTKVLAEYGACAGEIKIQQCPCGKQTNLEENHRCQMDDHNNIPIEYIDLNGVKHILYTQDCQKCGLVYQKDTYAADCKDNWQEKYSSSIGDEEILSYEKEIDEKSEYHHYKPTYVYGKGKSCKDGFTVKWVCEICGDLYRESCTAHKKIAVETIYLYNYGGCGGTIVQQECPCGQEQAVSWYGACKITKESTQYTDTNGMQHKVDAYTCKYCNLTYTIDTCLDGENTIGVKHTVVVDGKEVFSQEIINKKNDDLFEGEIEWD